uniref:YHS domain-containing protein n=1 Tax=Desulfatirhabdium butyrativorans TaxID=340467 RepID=A0A7C4RRB8_9BACT
MIKIALLFLLGYLGFRLLKAAILGNIRTVESNRREREPLADVMIQDPVCGVYFPQKSGFPLDVDGKTLYFCSAECREKFRGGKGEGDRS